MEILNTFGSVCATKNVSGFEFANFYRVSNTNANSRQKSVVRVYLADKLIAEQFINKRDPLGYVNRHNGKHRKQLREQCLIAGMSDNVFDNIFCI